MKQLVAGVFLVVFALNSVGIPLEVLQDLFGNKLGHCGQKICYCEFNSRMPHSTHRHSDPALSQKVTGEESQGVDPSKNTSQDDGQGSHCEHHQMQPKEPVQPKTNLIWAKTKIPEKGQTFSSGAPSKNYTYFLGQTLDPRSRTIFKPSSLQNNYSLLLDQSIPKPPQFIS